MRKTDKKLDNQLREILTDVCDMALKEFIGFQWLTHLVNYSNFPKSLKIICVFDTNDNLKGFMASTGQLELSTLIQEKLSEIDINMSRIARHISYDTEESCHKDNNGKWADRFSK